VTGSPPAPGSPALEVSARLDQRDAFGPTSPRGTLRVADGILSWQPRGWRAAVWRVSAGDVIGGAAATLGAYELWLDTPVTGTVAVAVDPPGGHWAAGGGNAPDVRGQLTLDAVVGALRAGGARIAGEPVSGWSRPGTGGLDDLWPW
jgi:hypothetical protein